MLKISTEDENLYLDSSFFRRQKELALSLERESSLERSRAQLELDWQRRYEEAERTGFDKQEELVKNLTQGKEEVKI